MQLSAVVGLRHSLVYIRLVADDVGAGAGVTAAGAGTTVQHSVSTQVAAAHAMPPGAAAMVLVTPEQSKASSSVPSPLMSAQVDWAAAKAARLSRPKTVRIISMFVRMWLRANRGAV